MAAQAATPPVAPSAEEVANAFIVQYYYYLHNSPEMVYKFYKDSSVLTHPDHNGVATSVKTMESISDKICSLDYKNCSPEIRSVDAQKSCNDGVIVLVTGSLTGRDNKRRIFTQSFFLAPQPTGYFVLNDVFRYVEVGEPSQNEATITGTGDASTSRIQNQEGTQLVEKNVHGLLQEERQVNDNEEIVIQADSHSNDRHYSADLESRVAALEDAPKKSYASIVNTETRKGPVEIYVPASTSEAALKTEKQIVDSAAQSSAQAPEALAPTATSCSTVSDSKVAEDEGEGYSIYIRNLPPRHTVHQLETEFKKFGPIKQNGVQVRSNRQQGFCFGFVEFQDLSSMQSAIEASPITIGNREAVIEIKRTTRRVGDGGTRFSAGRGVVQNDSFRGRGNFSGGRSFGRSNFGNRMELSWRPRSHSGEGDQQGRGRGRV